MINNAQTGELVYISAPGKTAGIQVSIDKDFMNKSAILGIVVAAVALTSCSGSSYQIPSNIVLPGSPQLSAGNVTYVPGTEEYQAFNAINSFRSAMGLGYWSQSIYLDQAAAAHMGYTLANLSQASCADASHPFMDDSETTGCTYFTGATPSMRAIVKGFYILENTVYATNVPTAAVGELYSVGSGANIVAAMVNTIYHRSGLMAQNTRYVGFARDSSGTIDPNSSTVTHWWISHGRLDAGQSVSSDYTGRYPINLQTGVPLYMCPEYPSVYSNVPGFNFMTSTSSPVGLTLSNLVNLTVTSFTVTPAGSSTPLSGKTWTMFNDPNLNTTNQANQQLTLQNPPPAVVTIPANQAFWVGDQPFQPNTTYTVNVTGSTYLTPYAITNPLTVTWSFTTGTSTSC